MTNWIKIKARFDNGRYDNTNEQTEFWAFKDLKGGWEIMIIKTHPIFKNLELKRVDDADGNEIDGYELEFDPAKGKSQDPQFKPKDLWFGKDANIKVKLIGSESDQPKPQAWHSQDTTPTDTNYRYCFSCNEWKKKTEINEIDLGGGNKTFNCNKCRKDLGETCLIFRCKDHESEIMKVWGTIEGVNKEKVFFSQCPQQGQEQDPNKPSKGLSGGVVAVIAIAVLALIGAGGWYWWKQKKEKDKEEAEL